MDIDEQRQYLNNLIQNAKDKANKLSNLVDAPNFPEAYKSYSYFVIHELRAGARSVEYHMNDVNPDDNDIQYFREGRIKTSNYIEHYKILMDLLNIVMLQGNHL